MSKQDATAKPVALTDDVFRVLKQRAAEMRTITYGELRNETGYHTRDRRQLEWIWQHVCRDHGLPDLTAIVVTTDKPFEPAPGWNRGGPGPASDEGRLRLWKNEVLSVWGYDWSNVELIPAEASTASTEYEFPEELPVEVNGVTVDPDLQETRLELTTTWENDRQSFIILIPNDEAEKAARDISQQIDHYKTTGCG